MLAAPPRRPFFPMGEQRARRRSSIRRPPGRDSERLGWNWWVVMVVAFLIECW